MTDETNCIMIVSAGTSGTFRTFCTGSPRQSLNHTEKGETDMSDMPEWLTELLSRLSEVFSKLLIKLGLKIIF